MYKVYVASPAQLPLVSGYRNSGAQETWVLNYWMVIHLVVLGRWSHPSETQSLACYSAIHCVSVCYILLQSVTVCYSLLQSVTVCLMQLYVLTVYQCGLYGITKLTRITQYFIHELQ